MTRYDRRGVLKRIGTVASVAVSGSLAGCGSGGGGNGGDGNGGGNGGGSSGPTVDMTDELVFDPKSITVSVGDTVTWENVGSIGHTVTAYEDKIPQGADYFASGGFDSEQAARDAYPDQGNIPAGESYQHTFETAGEFGYFCIPHELNGMTGTVVVEG
ncbi:MAG: plastocyanin/azurin family copper-binding protein [Halobacteriales archaeon]